MMKPFLFASTLSLLCAGLAQGQIVHQFNFGNATYEGTNSPGHADGLIPLSFDQWTTVNGNDIQFVDDQFVRFRRANGTGIDDGVSLTQTTSTANRPSDTVTGTGVFATELGENWRSYSRGGFPGRAVGAWF